MPLLLYRDKVPEDPAFPADPSAVHPRPVRQHKQVPEFSPSVLRFQGGHCLLSVWGVDKPPLSRQLETNILIKRQEDQEVEALVCPALGGGGGSLQALIMFASRGLLLLLLRSQRVSQSREHSSLHVHAWVGNLWSSRASQSEKTKGHQPASRGWEFSQKAGSTSVVGPAFQSFLEDPGFRPKMQPPRKTRFTEEEAGLGTQTALTVGVLWVFTATLPPSSPHTRSRPA